MGKQILTTAIGAVVIMSLANDNWTVMQSPMRSECRLMQDSCEASVGESDILSERVIAMLPRVHEAVSMNGRTYYYAAGTFYRSLPGGGCVIVEAPVGAVVSTLSPHRAAVTIGDGSYISDAGVYYRKVNSGYMVVSSDIGESLAMIP